MLVPQLVKGLKVATSLSVAASFCLSLGRGGPLGAIMMLANMVGIALRLITHREDLERLWPRIVAADAAARDILDTLQEAHALAAKIAPELIPAPGTFVVQPAERYDV